MSPVLELFLTFFKIGLFTFGGGYAMIGIIENICVEERKWITHDDMIHVTVIAESTPGPIAINCATFVGYKRGGFPGALAATFGVVLPSFIIIYIISMFLDNFLEITIIANAFRGIQVAVGILILNAAFNMIRKMKKSILSVSILAVSSVAMLLTDIFSWNFSTITMIILCGAFSAAVFTVIDVIHKKGGAAK